MDRVLDNVKTDSFVRCEKYCSTIEKKNFHSRLKGEVHEACFKIN